MTTESENNISQQNYAIEKETRPYLDLAFRPLFLIAIFMLTVPTWELFGEGNYNSLQKGLLLGTGMLFMLKNPPARPVVIIGFCMTLVSIFFFGALTEFQSFNWGRLFNAAVALASILIFYLANPTKDDRLFLVQWLSAITPLIVMFGFIFMFTHGRAVYSGDNTGVLRYGGGSIPAYLAAASYASTIGYAMLYRHTRAMRYLLLAVFCLFISVKTGSRMPTVCALACLGTIIFFALQNALSRIIFIFSGITFLVVGLFTFGQDIMVRFTSQTSSGRDVLWNSVLVWAERMPYTGIGFGHHSFVIPEYIQLITKTKATHNEYVRIFAELGYRHFFNVLL